MKNVLTYISIFYFISGCGGAEPESFSSATGEDSGTGGEDGSGGSEDSGTGGENEGSGGDTSSSTSSGCQPSITCVSVGAECGTVLDDGCGNEIECPNNCTGFLTCGGGGDQFKCGCTPKSCLDLEAECGNTDDGCGGALDCGVCDSSDPYVTCGGFDAPDEFNNPPVQGAQNSCNGGCTAAPLFDDYCYGLALPPRMWFCSTPSGPAPGNGCEPYGSPTNKHFEGWENAWCCPIE